MNILWVKTELLHPVNRGGRIRTYNMLRELRRNHHVTYLALDDGTGASDAASRAPEYCDVLDVIPFRTTPKHDFLRLYTDLLVNLFSPLPYAVAKYRSPGMQQRILTRLSGGEYDVVVCDFLFPSQNVPRGLGCPTILFQHNVEAAIWQRHTEVARSPLKKRYLAAQWRRMARFERDECRRFDQVVAVSEADAAKLQHDYGLGDVTWVPTGVDIDYFTRSGTIFPQRHEIVFVGALDWLPNEDAVLHFIESVLPIVRASVPEVSFRLVGRNPTARIRQAASRYPGVTLIGEVADVRPYMERAAVFVVPIRIGGGTRLKIFEALAMSNAVVTTSVGAEGLPIVDKVHALIADEPGEFAAAVIELIRQPDWASRLGRAGAELVRQQFAWSKVAAEFERICVELVERTVVTRNRIEGELG